MNKIQRRNHIVVEYRSRKLALLTCTVLLAIVMVSAASPGRSATLQYPAITDTDQPTTQSFLSAKFRSQPGDYFGSAVAIAGSIAAVGAGGVNHSSGAVRIFARSGSRWRLQTTL